jgi:hypothetical protein
LAFSLRIQFQIVKSDNMNASMSGNLVSIEPIRTRESQFLPEIG